MEVDHFHSETQSFLSWLSAAGIRISPKMALKDLRSESRGRGAVAIADIEEDEVIFTIPRSAVLSISTALPDIDTEESKKALLAMPSWLALTALIISEGRKKDSKWAPYLTILPQQLDSLVFWSEQELKELQASAVVNKIGKEGAEKLFSEHLAPLGLGDSDIETCHRVASIIMAYAFDIPEEKSADAVNGHSSTEQEQDDDELVSDDGDNEKTILSMIALADMLNADADRNNARLYCDSQDLEMRAIIDIKTGEEILNNYGQLPRSDLLRRYGYITDQYAIHDVAEISTEAMLSVFQHGEQLLRPGLQLSNEDLKNRIELCQREDVYDDSYDLRHAGDDDPSIPDELLAFLFILLLDDENLSKLASSQSHLPSRSRLQTETVGHVLACLLQLREREYATTLEEDEALLNARGLPHRTQMAIQVRLGEKKVLREAIRDANSFQGSNKYMRGSQAPQDNTPPQKGKRMAEESSQPKKKRQLR